MTKIQPDHTAVRTALWRALHLLADEKPYIFEDNVGFKLIEPEKDWHERADMKYTRRLRASIVARARLVEDLAKEQIANGVKQYVLLGAGLDSFAQRNAEIISQVHIYEIDEPGTLAWKKERLVANGYKIAEKLHFVPVDFERLDWWTELLTEGFDNTQRSFVACTGVSLYLTKEAIANTLRKMASLACGSTMAMEFYLPLELLDEADKPMQEIAIKGAAASGTPFVSFFREEEILELAGEAGLKQVKTVSTESMTERYFKGRSDNFVPASGAFFLIATL